MRAVSTKKLKAAVIGCGAIGRVLARVLKESCRDRTVLKFLCDRNPERAAALKKDLKLRASITDLPEAVAKADLILETASQESVLEIFPFIKNRRKILLLMSAGGLWQIQQRQPGSLRKLQSRIYVPSGAVAGIDGVLAARESGLHKVVLITRKPPEGLREAPFFKEKRFPALKGDEEVCVFRGSAGKAIEHFPQNINVAAVLSMAGSGACPVAVEVWTSRSYHGNSHEIRVDYADGRLWARTDNKPSKDNPKTSALAVYSAVATLKRLFGNQCIGT